MPLNAKGMRMKSALIKKFGKRRGTAIFYSLERRGKVMGVRKRKTAPRRKGK